MSRAVDITGKQYGEWTVLGYHDNIDDGTHRWLCRCSCGVEKPVRRTNLQSGQSTRCIKCARKARRGRKLIVRDY